MKHVLLITLLLSTFNLYAKKGHHYGHGNFWGHLFNPTKDLKGDYLNPVGFAIKLNPMAKKSFATGETVTITGEFCNRGRRDKAKHNEEEFQCRKMNEEHVNARFYFPDHLTDVSDQVVVTKVDNKFTFSFTTPALKGNDVNTLIVSLGHVAHKTRKLLHFQAKVDKRLLFLKRYLDKVNANTSNRHKKFWGGYVARIEKMISILEGLSTKIQDALGERDDMLAELRYPLIVDNQIPADFDYSSIVYDLRYEAKASPGALLDGEVAQINTKVTRMDSSYLPSLDGEYVFQQIFNGEVNFESEPKILAKGESIEFEYTTPKLSSRDANLVQMGLMKEEINPCFGAKGFKKFLCKFKEYKRKKKGTDKILKPWGWHEFALTVAKDEQAPRLASDISGGAKEFAGIQYYNSLPSFNFSIVDDFGRVDQSSLVLSINGQDAKDKFAKDVINDGEQISFSGALPETNDGAYELVFSGKDNAGNVSDPSEVKYNFVLDQAAPVISLSKAGPIYTNESSFSFDYEVVEGSPFTIVGNYKSAEVLNSSDLTGTVSVELSTLNNEFELSATDVAGNSSGIIKLDQIYYDADAPVISSNLNADYYTSNANFSLSINITDALSVQNVVKFNGQEIANNSSKQMSIELALEQGENTLEVVSIDQAGNSQTYLVERVYFDNVAPVISSATLGGFLTNNPVHTVNWDVEDASPILVQVIHQDQVVYESPLAYFNYDLTLSEGINTTKLHVSDKAGNIAIHEFAVIDLDTTPPVISNLLPPEGENIFDLDFTVTGRSNEFLSMAKINEQQANLTDNGLSFEAVVVAPSQGAFKYEVVATDLAGNTTSAEVEVEIVLKVLNKDLISLDPNAEGTGLIVKGMPGAARPNVLVKLESGLLYSSDVQAAADGSFMKEIPYLNSINLTATDENLGRTDTITVHFQIDTTFSGVVKDAHNNPLPGVKVTINSSGQSAITDGGGVFNIPDAVTGDQLITIDGTTIPIETVGVNKKFPSTNIKVSIGTNQSNVLPKPIYLSPLLFDGTETEVAEDSATEVTSPHAPGVALRIPAGVANFPGGSKSGHINMVEVSSSRTTVPPPEFAVPNTVYALEPSGLEFSEPVELVVPNVNEFPPGMQVVVLSKNSLKGSWEVDGIARVSESGAEIVTEPGNGITHFSEVFVAPIFPKVTKPAEGDIRGADALNGALSTAISLPTTKILGEDIGLNLVYNSRWANPNVIVSNTFDIPRERVAFNGPSESIRSSLGSATTDVKVDTWVEPDLVRALFRSGNVTSGQMNFRGLPNKSVVSYAMDLAGFESGPHVYEAKYEVHLKQMILTTITTRSKQLFGSTDVQVTDNLQSKGLQTIFPPDINGIFYVQNKVHSPFGRGWNLGGVERILNPNGLRVTVENGDGSITSYVSDNAMETIITADNEVTGVGFNNLPAVLFSNNSKVYEVDLEQTNPSAQLLHNIPSDSGIFPSHKMACGGAAAVNCAVEEFCHMSEVPYTRDVVFNSLLKTDSGTSFALSEDHRLLHLDGDSYVFAAGSAQIPPVALSEHIGTGDAGQTAAIYRCREDGMHCTVPNYSLRVSQCARPEKCSQYPVLVTSYAGGVPGDPGEFRPTAPPGFCGSYTGTNRIGEWPAPGYEGGLAGVSNLNSPTAILPWHNDLILIADKGNNRIRQYNLTTKVLSDFAGNGQTYDNGDGKKADQASIYHPLSLAKGALNEIYVTTERGFIRKIGNNGFISTLNGSGNFQLADKGKLDELELVAPNGIAIDGDTMYVSDTGRHRVLKIDLISKEYEVVAGGEGSCQGVTSEPKIALQTSLCYPKDLAFDQNKNLLVFDSGHKSIRRISFEAAEATTAILVSQSDDKSTLTKNNDGTFVRNFRNGNTVSYNAKGLQVESNNRLGQKLEVQYDSEDRVERIIQPTGNTAEFTYNGDHLSSIRDFSGRVTNFVFDGVTLTQVNFPDSTNKKFEYLPGGMLNKETNKRGFATRYEFNEYNRLTKVIRADDTEVKMSDSGSKLVGNSYTEGLTGDLKGYDKEENYDGIVDAKNVETKMIKDGSGFVTTVIDAKGNTTHIERDVKGRVTYVERADGTYSTFTYDEEYGDLLAQYESSTDGTLSYTYNDYGQILTETNQLGQTIVNEYYGNGLLRSVNNHVGFTTEYTYFANGLAKSRINEFNQVEHFTYDAQGNLKTVTDHEGKKITYTRDSHGNIINVENANGQHTVSAYDEFNRLKSVKSPKNETTSYFYDAKGNLEKIQDPLGNLTTFEYDILDQLISKTTPRNKTYSMTYDDNGNIETETDASGRIKTFEYDELNQLVKKILMDDTYEFDYDVRGNMTMVKNNVSQIDYTYEFTHAGKVLGSVRARGLGSLANMPDTVLSFDYNKLGERIEMETPYGDFSYNHDHVNRLSRVEDPSGNVFEIYYNSLNRFQRISSPVYDAFYQFDSTGFMTLLQYNRRNEGYELEKYDFTKDNIGNRRSIRNKLGLNTFSYDDNNQLTGSSYDDLGIGYFYNYDEIGNRVSDKIGSFTYSADKQLLTSYGGYNYNYDDNGNLTSKVKADLSETRNFFYNSQNQLIKIEDFEGSTLKMRAEYYFDAIGRRIQKVVTYPGDSSKDKTRRYVYDGQEVLAELNDANETLAVYTHSTLRTDDALSVAVTEKGKDAGVAKSSGDFYFIKDALGSVTGVVNSAKNVVQRNVYSPYGIIEMIVDGSGNDMTANPVVSLYHSFTGREYDSESGLYYYRARYYDSSVGRFISEDPFDGEMNLPMTVVNKYAYVVNNPIRYTDPTGKFFDNQQTYGNYCGPGYPVSDSEKRIQNGDKEGVYRDFNRSEPPIDAFDRACYNHDIRYFNSYEAREVEGHFIRAGADFRLKIDTFFAQLSDVKTLWNDPSGYLFRYGSTQVYPALFELQGTMHAARGGAAIGQQFMKLQVSAAVLNFGSVKQNFKQFTSSLGDAFRGIFGGLL